MHVRREDVTTLGTSVVLPSTHPDDALRFLQTWHRLSPGHVVISLINPHRERPRSRAFPVAQLIDHIAQQGVSDMTSNDAGVFQSYVSVSTHVSDPTGPDGHRKGGESTVLAVPGVWLDLDVKPGNFTSAAQVDSFLQALGAQPTLVVDSGSGGRHAYWAFAAGPVDVERGRRLALGWWARAQEIATLTYPIDRVANADRIMRLPGTIRWPKPEESCAPSEVRLLFDDGPWYNPDTFEAAVAPSLERFELARTQARAALQDADSRASARLTETLTHIGTPGSWSHMLALATIEDLFNQTTTWEQVLVPHGWTRLDTYPDHHGRSVWARPGSRSKSAYTDYPASPHVMALHSNSPATGLLRLKDTGVPLTKFRIEAELTYGGDTAAIVADILDERG